MNQLSVAIFGADGQLGRALEASAPEHVQVVAYNRAHCDITDPAQIAACPPVDLVVNAAAYTQVDQAETDYDRAFAVNATAVQYLAEWARSIHAPLIHISTDYVFSGEIGGESAKPRRPWHTDDIPNPQTAYGRTKYAGEQAIEQVAAQEPNDEWQAAIVRTAWVWSGPTQPDSRDFVSTMLQLAQDPQRQLKVVEDQVGNPTFVGDLAGAIWELVAAFGKAGVHVDGLGQPNRRWLEKVKYFHVTGTGRASWFEFAQAIFRASGQDPQRVQPCATSEYPTPAVRPAWSVLDPSSWIDAGFAPLPEWEDTLIRVLA